ncbi:hypothetical protein ABZP36_000606 [Zizania latifolia]
MKSLNASPSGSPATHAVASPSSDPAARRHENTRIRVSFVSANAAGNAAAAKRSSAAASTEEETAIVRDETS